MAGRNDEHSNQKHMIIGSVLLGLFVLLVDALTYIVTAPLQIWHKKD